jgi:hypothetical protein
MPRLVHRLVDFRHYINGAWYLLMYLLHGWAARGLLGNWYLIWDQHQLSTHVPINGQ